MPKKRVQWEGKKSSSLATFLRAVRTTLEDNGLETGRFKFSHIAHETMGELERLKNWRLGLEKGIPDFVIVIPHEISLTGGTQILWIEMKAIHETSGKKGTADTDQLDWLKVLAEAPGSKTKLCMGEQEALVFILDELALPTLHLLYRHGHIESVEDLRYRWRLLERLGIS